MAGFEAAWCPKGSMWKPKGERGGGMRDRIFSKPRAEARGKQAGCIAALISAVTLRWTQPWSYREDLRGPHEGAKD